MDFNLQRFVAAQESVYARALAEIRAGLKQSHWMWFIFPQLRDLGSSPTALFYGIRNLEEAAAYLRHPILGNRLVEISQALLEVENKSAHEIFGTPDDRKLQSCMTLFLCVNASALFEKVLQKYYSGLQDMRTVSLLDSHR